MKRGSESFDQLASGRAFATCLPCDRDQEDTCIDGDAIHQRDRDAVDRIEARAGGHHERDGEGSGEHERDERHDDVEGSSEDDHQPNEDERYGDRHGLWESLPGCIFKIFGNRGEPGQSRLGKGLQCGPQRGYNLRPMNAVSQWAFEPDDDERLGGAFTVDVSCG